MLDFFEKVANKVGLYGLYAISGTITITAIIGGVSLGLPFSATVMTGFLGGVSVTAIPMMIKTYRDLERGRIARVTDRNRLKDQLTLVRDIANAISETLDREDGAYEAGMKKVENYTRTYLDLPPADNPPPFSMQEENQRSLLVISKIHNIILIGMNQNEDPLHMLEKIIPCVESFTKRTDVVGPNYNQNMSAIATTQLRQRSAAPRPPSTQPNASSASNIAPPPYQSYEDR